MSLILEALRRADAQRERDPARGIHAQSVPPYEDDGGGSFPEPAPQLARRLLPWAAGLVGALAALVGWREIRPPSELTPWAATAAASTAAPQARPARAIQPPPALQIPPAAAPRGSASPPAHHVAPPVQPSARPAGPQAAEQPPAFPAAPVPVPAPAPVPPVAPGGRAPASTSQVLGPLPQDAPALAVTGGVYSADPARRMLIVNGEVVGEGAEPVAGVRVQEIRPGSAVLLFRGQPYAQGF